MQNQRKDQILEAIVRYFINTATPIGSLLLKDDFDISTATIRNDMASLEKEGLIYQPYTSSGRVPTEVGYRFYVDKLIKISDQERKKVLNKLSRIQDTYYHKKAIEKVYDCVAMLSQMVNDIAFATIPHNRKTFYLGLASVLRKPEFIKNISYASEVVEVLENGFFEVLDELDMNDHVKIFIGKENIIEQMQSCSMLAIEYNYFGYKGVIGILGPMRMDYSFNKIALEVVHDVLK